MKHTEILFAEIPKFWYVKAGDTYNNHWALKGLLQSAKT
jgi:hypothetical protein